MTDYRPEQKTLTEALREEAEQLHMRFLHYTKQWPRISLIDPAKTGESPKEEK
jgi:hypothetical protein